MSDCSAAMKVIGEINGVSVYWAEPGHFTKPGVYYWDGKNNVHVPVPPPMSDLPPEVVEAVEHLRTQIAGGAEVAMVYARPLETVLSALATVTRERDERETYHQNRAEAWQEEIADLHTQLLDAAEARDAATLSRIKTGGGA